MPDQVKPVLEMPAFTVQPWMTEFVERNTRMSDEDEIRQFLAWAKETHRQLAVLAEKWGRSVP